MISPVLALLLTSQLSPAPHSPDLWISGNRLDRGHPVEDQEGENGDQTGATSLGETLVTPALLDATRGEIPYSVHTVLRGELREQSYRTLPQALRNTPGVLVQETSHGQGSPYVRGWTGFRNLLLIDGVRVNNSVFRDGPNQYWNTVDVYSLEGVEVVKGPGAVLYGSDSIGATVNALTPSPWSFFASGEGHGGTLYTRFSSAEKSLIGRAEGGLALGTNTALGFGFTGKHFGDFRGGREAGSQPYTGYDEWDYDLKLEHDLDENRRLIVSRNHVKQNDVPRTHQTIFGQPFEGTTAGSDLKRDLDQERVLSSVQLRGEGLGNDERLFGIADEFSLGLSWHSQSESRDRIRSSMAREFQSFDADTLGFQAWGSSPSQLGRWTYGADWYRDFVDSESSRNPIQGPVADDATYDLLGVFLQDEVALSEQLNVTFGLRGQYAAVDADSVRDPVSGDQTSLDKSWSDLVGSMRSIYTVTSSVDVFLGISQGFRAPNLSDLTRFDTARTDEFEVASTDLEPEQFLSYEAGIRARDETRTLELSAYYTDVEDLIIRRPTGNTNTDGEFEITKENAGDGYVLGAEARATWAFRPAWSVFLQTAWMDGKVETFPTAAQVLVEEPIDRLLPWQGHLGLRYEQLAPGDAAPAWVEFLLTFADKADKNSTRDAGDTTRIPPGGTPGYVVFDLRGGCDLRENLRLDLGLENILNEDYRFHGSGSNRPGRSLVIGLTLTL
ncbi:MAG: hemoglobin/transferrin/lactoferrin receptor protein [Planctomycetota bacterium]|jgi:hemoglobin/transferrin/lactoferrin receptor protein